jgi:membrane protein
MNKKRNYHSHIFRDFFRKSLFLKKSAFFYCKTHIPKWKNAMFDFYKFTIVFRKKFLEDSVFNQSASLTFVTLLGFVPVIIFILFFLPEMPFLKLESHIGDVIKNIFVPESANQIFEHISELAQRKISFNLFSFIILLFTSYSLFKIINDTFDHILVAKEEGKRGFLSDMVKFIGMTVFGSLLILILLSASSLPLISKFFVVPFLQTIFTYFAPFILIFIVFTLGFFYIPSVKVSRKSIFIGAAVSASFWILFKSIFNWYIFNLTNTKLIFGYLASVPIFLFWIYANWLIILSGVIIVSILEKRHIKPVISKRELKTIRITIEKVMFEDEIDKLKEMKLSQNEFAEILKSISDDNYHITD